MQLAGSGSVALLCALIAVGRLQEARDDRQILRWPRPPVPPSGRLITISHNGTTLQKIASSANLPIGSFAPAFDMYYEANFDHCDRRHGRRNIVMLSGTNGATNLYWGVLEHFQQHGWCTLNFDYRAHGRSEVAAGEYTAELFGEDAAAIIRHVFKGQAAHLVGWSLGGALGYYLSIEHPDLVHSLALTGMTSCFGRDVTSHDGLCDDSWAASVRNPFGVAGILAPILHQPFLLRLPGTELLGRLAALPFLFNHQTHNEVMYFHRQQRPTALTRSFAIWSQWNYSYYHEAITTIQVPVLLLAGSLESSIGMTHSALLEDSRRIPLALEPVILQGYSHFLLWESVDGVAGLKFVHAAHR